MLLFFILSPFALALLSAWLVGRRPAMARLLAAWPAVLAGVFALAFRTTLAEGPLLVEWAWAPSLGLSLSFNLDALGLLFAMLITGIGALVVLYAARYLAGHPQAARFYTALFAFMGAMLGVVLSDNVLTLFVFWELTGFTSFLLIGFDHERAESRAAALQALIVTGGGGLALLAAAVLLWDVSGTTSLAAMAASSADLAAHSFYPAIAVLVLLAAFTKSAQVPFHFWLPNAMAAPTPVSAYLHSATMVKAGVYLIARMTPVLGATALWTTTVTVVGAVTMVVGAVRAVQETDLKRVLAYSTISALGVMTMLLGIGTREAVVAAVVYLVAHACYKGALFLVTGIIDHETGTRDVTRLGGLRRVMPITAAVAGLAALSMAGVPLTLGFLGKEALYEALLHGGGWWVWLLAAGVSASVLLGLAGFIAGVSPFQGPPGPATAAHEAPWELWAPPLVLATAGVVIGIVPTVINAPSAAVASSITAMPMDVTLSLWHGFTPVLGLSMLTLVFIGAAYRVRRALWRRPWRPRFGTEQAYDWTLAGLDAISRVIAPALHSASLRSYVMVIVVTSVVLIGVPLATSPAVRSVTTATSVQVHELLIVVLIIAAALSAARARSTMAAVLSLGTVGYGVALMFLSFGAPDLAMTQFSVETLTVVIYVLVFRHFRGLGGLSPRIIRWRDAFIAAGIGALIGGLVLAVGTSGTPSRLAGYFVEHGPTLAHGRNIVNVILVDFRAFDTLGEITVLATAAIGVRALLRLAAAERPATRPARKDGDA